MSIPKCLITSCLNTSAPALKRGLCMTCYSRAKRMVEAGTTTWDKLVEIGLALPTDIQDGSTDAFMTEFTNRSKDANSK